MRTAPPRPAPGFTLIETLITLAIAVVLSLVAIPSWQGQMQRARRADAMVSLIQVQLAQSRWRASNDGYGSLREIGVSSASPSGYYALQLSTGSGDDYVVVASATGAQAADVGCRVLRLRVDGADIERASGPDARAANDAAANRRCWGL